MAVMIVVGSSLVWGVSKLGQWFFINADRLQAIYLSWTGWLEDAWHCARRAIWLTVSMFCGRFVSWQGMGGTAEQLCRLPASRLHLPHAGP
ncbi:hypothetical protein JS562_52835, partial [Agrobacterium sp. S2]|nr:hypothetical protein [Agrobacterium sp. S2]